MSLIDKVAAKRLFKNTTREIIANLDNNWECSGVQRLLDARGQRGSSMPSNFCQTSSLQNNFYSSPNISDDLLFNRSPKIFNSCPKISDNIFFRSLDAS